MQFLYIKESEQNLLILVCKRLVKCLFRQSLKVIKGQGKDTIKNNVHFLRFQKDMPAAKKCLVSDQTASKTQTWLSFYQYHSQVLLICKALI